METVNKSLEINGTIEFYDAPDKTNTYAVTGYNSYYMSLIGKNDVYAGTNKGTNSVSMEIVNTLSLIHIFICTDNAGYN